MLYILENDLIKHKKINELFKNQKVNEIFKKNIEDKDRLANMFLSSIKNLETLKKIIHKISLSL